MSDSLAQSLEKIYNDLVVMACTFSLYSKMGPDAVFFYPKEAPKSTHPPIGKQKYIPSQTYLQIAVKSISLLLGDFSFENDDIEQLKDTHLFGILPYADLGGISLTYFTYVQDPIRKRLMPATFSLIVDETKRSFLYDHIERLRILIRSFTAKIVELANETRLFETNEYEDLTPLVTPHLLQFFQEIYKIQEKPLSPIIKNRRIKIIFTGIENSGKTSFLSVINKKYSQLVALSPTNQPSNDTINLLGTTIIRWDIPGMKNQREEALLKSELYLYETDVLYFFVDVMNPQIEESKQFLSALIHHIQNYDTKIPIVIIMTKVDEDISHNPEIRNVIHTIINDFTKIIGDRPIKFFETSIFAPFTVLNAFSYGLRQLSPNRVILEHLLKEFMERHNQITGLLTNENGIVLATQELTEKYNVKKITLRQIFEMTAPHFTTIASQYNEFFAIDGKTTQFKFSEEDLVILKRFTIENFRFFLLFYTKQKESLAELEKDFPKFIQKIESLLKAYIT